MGLGTCVSLTAGMALLAVFPRFSSPPPLLPWLTSLLITGHARVLADSFPGSAPYEGYNYGSFGTFQSGLCLPMPSHSTLCRHS